MPTAREHWEQFRAEELAKAQPIIHELGFALEDTQVHISGERYLMSGEKLVLKGKRTGDGKRVIIKFSTYAKGIAEIEREHEAREALRHLDFAYRHFFSPEEILFQKNAGYILAITEFIQEEKSFLQHSSKEQFFLALRAFETQESLHLTASVHTRAVKGVFERVHAQEYLTAFAEFQKNITATNAENADLLRIFSRASTFLVEQRQRIERYCDFLTHTDFVPHNLRIVGHDIYLLDHSSIRFGNKYESWARFLNYMVIYNPELERWLMQYVKDNRAEEYISLRTMRIFKLGFLLQFYAGTLSQASGDLQTLAVARISFWSQVLEYMLDDKPIPNEIVQSYRALRDRLRSPEEKDRQKELQQLF